MVSRASACNICEINCAGAASSDDFSTGKAVSDETIGELRGVLWHRCADSGSLEGEPFVELKNGVGRRPSFDVKTLPSANLACAYSGADDDAEPAYDAIKRWMSVRGYRLAGPKREIYLDDMLEIQFPLQSA